MSGKYSQKHLDHAKQSATDALKTSSKRVIQETAEATDDFTGIKIANKIKKVSKNLETVTNKNNKEIPQERYMSLKKDKKLL